MRVEFNDESLPKGTEVYVNHLGALVNGKSVEIDEEQLKQFEAETGQTVAAAFANDERVKLSGQGAKTTTPEGGEN